MLKNHKDELILLSTILIISIVLISLDSFEYLYNLSRKYEHFQLDEFFVIFIAISICTTFYALKKYFDLKKVKNRLNFCNQRDTLTELKNREEFFKVCESQKKYLILLNIIDFTNFNKHLGFKKADELLKKAALCLRDIVYEEIKEPTYRIYGDEFAFYYDKDNIKEVLESLKSKFEERLFEVDSYKFYMHLNIAYSNTKPKYLTAAEALLAIRKSIEKSISSYNPQKIYCTNSLDMLNIIREALDKNQIIPVYQGIYDNNSQEIYKYETLARIKKEDKLISPFEFINVSKKFKLYHKITHRIIECAFNDFRNSSCEFSINLSYIDIINPNTCNFIFSMLKQNPQIAKRLTIEFLETENIADYNILIEFTKKIKDYGTKVALDDFGAGYSNWNNILKLNPDFIKIDGSIIQNLLGNTENINLIKLIVEFSKMNQIKTIAEFVDSKELANLIKELKIDFSQGFLFAKPNEKAQICL